MCVAVYVYLEIYIMYIHSNTRDRLLCPHVQVIEEVREDSLLPFRISVLLSTFLYRRRVENSVSLSTRESRKVHQSFVLSLDIQPDMIKRLRSSLIITVASAGFPSLFFHRFP